MAAATARSGNSGIFWMNGGMFTFTKLHLLPCPLPIRTYLIESHKSLRKSNTDVTSGSMLGSCYF